VIRVNIAARKAMARRLNFTFAELSAQPTITNAQPVPNYTILTQFVEVNPPPIKLIKLYSWMEA